MKIRSLSLTDWRSYRSVEVSFGDGLTAVVGKNGHGKTNLIESIAWMSGAGSFRGAPDDALIRLGAETAVIRSTIEADDGREEGRLYSIFRSKCVSGLTNSAHGDPAEVSPRHWR